MAEHPIAERDDEISKHLTGCSPFFNRYMDTLAPASHPVPSFRTARNALERQVQPALL